MPKSFTIISFVLFSQLANAQLSTTNTVKSSDTIKYAVLSNRFLPNSSSIKVQLTKREIELTTVLIKKQIKKFGERDYKFDDYRMQFIASIKNNQKVVSINGFCEAFVDWQKEFVHVSDGGSCYFSAEVNLKSKKLTFFQFNGEA